MGHVKHPGRKDKPYLKFTEVQQSGQLERAPASKLNPRTEEVEGEGGRHGTEELKDGNKTARTLVTSPSLNSPLTRIEHW